MNCFIWILLLLGCGGCGNSYSTRDNSCGNSCNNNWNGCNHGCIQPRNNHRMNHNHCDNECNNRMDCENTYNNNRDYGKDCDCDCDCGCDNCNPYPSARPWGERSGHMSPPSVPSRIREDGCGCDD